MTNAQKMKKAIDLLEGFANDCQFDETDPGYLGFVNVGVDAFTDQADKETWAYVCANPVLFASVLPQLGLATEGGLDLDETVFVLKK